MIANLEGVVAELWAAGVTDVRVDGSFLTEKPEPGDIDRFWVLDEGVRFEEIPMLLRDFSLVRDPASGKPKFPMWFRYGIELYIHPRRGAQGVCPYRRRLA